MAVIKAVPMKHRRACGAAEVRVFVRNLGSVLLGDRMYRHMYGAFKQRTAGMSETDQAIMFANEVFVPEQLCEADGVPAGTDVVRLSELVRTIVNHRFTAGLASFPLDGQPRKGIGKDAVFALAQRFGLRGGLLKVGRPQRHKAAATTMRRAAAAPMKAEPDQSLHFPPRERLGANLPVFDAGRCSPHTQTTDAILAPWFDRSLHQCCGADAEGRPHSECTHSDWGALLVSQSASRDPLPPESTSLDLSCACASTASMGWHSQIHPQSTTSQLKCNTSCSPDTSSWHSSWPGRTQLDSAPCCMVVPQQHMHPMDLGYTLRDPNSGCLCQTQQPCTAQVQLASAQCAEMAAYCSDAASSAVTPECSSPHSEPYSEPQQSIWPSLHSEGGNDDTAMFSKIFAEALASNSSCTASVHISSSITHTEEAKMVGMSDVNVVGAAAQREIKIQARLPGEASKWLLVPDMLNVTASSLDKLCSELHAMLTRLGHISAEETTGVRVVAVKDEDDDEWIGLPALDALPSGVVKLKLEPTVARSCSHEESGGTSWTGQIGSCAQAAF